MHIALPVIRSNPVSLCKKDVRIALLSGLAGRRPANEYYIDGTACIIAPVRARQQMARRESDLIHCRQLCLTACLGRLCDGIAVYSHGGLAVAVAREAVTPCWNLQLTGIACDVKVTIYR